MPEKYLLFKDRKGNVIASALTGGAILAFLAAAVFVMPEPSDFQRGVMRFFIAISAALLATFFLGGVVLQGNLAGSRVGAGGGFALFILIQFVFDPLKIQAVTADAAPKIVPPREEVRKAQETLAQLGMYNGAADGIPGTATRLAIRRFQTDLGLQATGYVDPSTEQAFTKAAAQTSKFEGEKIAATSEQRAFVISIINQNGLKTPIALPVVFDAVVHNGPTSTKRYANQATEIVGGSPAKGASERAWLLAFLQARSEHIDKVIPYASKATQKRIQEFRSKVETLPQ
jgi:putative peptidoglycan binding protein/glycosyl hydrolase family 46